MQSLIDDGDRLSIDRDTLQGYLQEGRSIVVLDVRPASEREEWHIPGSIHVDAYDALKRNEQGALAGLNLPDDRPIVTVCGSGRTSLTAARQLRDAGKSAMSLEGGMKAWSLAFNTADVPLAETAAAVVQIRRTGKGCLSYLAAGGDEAMVIDPSLPPETYIGLADRRGWRIAHVLDTHIHADHLSRSRLLADATGAVLHLPDQRRVRFDYAPIGEGDILEVGDVRLKALRTPGHTDESTVYLLDEAALFTGDTLFVEGVGRPDLEASGDEARTRARALHDSLHRVLREVSPDAVVLPGHTSRPASFDGQVVGETLERIRRRLGVLSLSKEDFTRRILDGIPPSPPNYERIVALNEAGTTPVDGILDLEAGANRCAVT